MESISIQERNPPNLDELAVPNTPNTILSKNLNVDGIDFTLLYADKYRCEKCSQVIASFSLNVHAKSHSKSAGIPDIIELEDSDEDSSKEMHKFKMNKFHQSLEAATRDPPRTKDLARDPPQAKDPPPSIRPPPRAPPIKKLPPKKPPAPKKPPPPKKKFEPKPTKKQKAESDSESNSNSSESILPSPPSSQSSSVSDPDSSSDSASVSDPDVKQDLKIEPQRYIPSDSESDPSSSSGDSTMKHASMARHQHIKGIKGYKCNCETVFTNYKRYKSHTSLKKSKCKRCGEYLMCRSEINKHMIECMKKKVKFRYGMREKKPHPRYLRGIEETIRRNHAIMDENYKQSSGEESEELYVFNKYRKYD